MGGMREKNKTWRYHIADQQNECFYVTLVPVTVKASTLKTNQKQLMLSVKYFGGSKLDNYDIADKLEGLFARSLKVNDRYLNISSVEPNFLVDEVGDMLDFLIYITYFDFIKLNNETCDNMQDINLDMKGWLNGITNNRYKL